MEVVLVGQFLAGGDVTRRDDPDSPVEVFRLAVRFAAMVDEHCRTEAIDDLATISCTEEIGYEAVLVALVSDVFAEARAVIFHDGGPFFYGPGRVATCGMNGRRTNHEA